MKTKLVALSALMIIACELPLTATGADEARIAARKKIFGVENVDHATGAIKPDKVIFSWLSNSSFATSIAGRVLLLDTFVTRLEVSPGRVPFVIKDLVDLKPEAILLGHGHRDHADNAAYIAAKTGASIYATEETCAAMNVDLDRMKKDAAIQNDPVARIDPATKINCVSVTAAGSAPATQIVKLDLIEPLGCVIAFRHLHSIAVPPDAAFPPTPVRIIVDPRDAQLFPRGVSLTPGDQRQSGQMDLRTSGGNGAGGGASLFFQFVMRGGNHFTFAWHDSAGALREGKGNGWDGTPEDGRRILEVLNSLPPTDVQNGTASSANFDNNGLRDLIMYQRALKPKIYIPNHLTTGTATREASSMSVYSGYRRQLELMGLPRAEWPDIRWLVDPSDYARPIVFDLADAAWRNPAKADSIARFCGS